MKSIVLFVTIIIFAAGCRKAETAADAFGTFEATEVIVSAETSGRIVSYPPGEGSVVAKGEILALIDTTLLKLQEAEIDAGMKSIRTRIASVDAQNRILDQQIENLAINIRRTEKMLSDGAATQKQLDDLLGQDAVLKKQIAANNTQKASVMAELALYESRKATVAEQVSRCVIKSPLGGTLIQKYAEEGEVTAAGKALAKVADLSVMKLKVYISGAMLAKVSAGNKCTVRIDSGEKDYCTYSGTVSHISEKAEFTPKIIQTREERVTLVYAVTIEVANDGKIKAGMPGEAIFTVQPL